MRDDMPQPKTKKLETSADWYGAGWDRAANWYKMQLRVACVVSATLGAGLGSLVTYLFMGGV
jgi:hypothetical protein